MGHLKPNTLMQKSIYDCNIKTSDPLGTTAPDDRLLKFSKCTCNASNTCGGVKRVLMLRSEPSLNAY